MIVTECKARDPIVPLKMADEVFLICWIGKFVAEGTCGSHASREYCSEKSGGDPT